MKHLNNFNSFLAEALKPSEYRPFYKYWKEMGADDIHYDLFKKYGNTKGRLYIPYTNNIKEEVELYLKGLGYNNIDFVGGYANDKYNRSMSIGKILKKHNNDKLLLKYTKENKRDREYDTSDLLICITRNPYDLAGCSTGRDWRSCVSIYGSESKTLYADIREGTMIAYLIRRGDTNIENPITRVSIKPYENESGYRIYIPETKMYGKQNWDFREAVYNWCKEWQDLETGRLDGEYDLVDGIYNDGLKNIEIIDGEVSANTERIISKGDIYNDDTAYELVMDFYENSGMFDDDSFYDDMINDITERYDDNSELVKYEIINKHGFSKKSDIGDYINLSAYHYNKKGYHEIYYNNSCCEFAVYVDVVEFYNLYLNNFGLRKYINSKYGDYGEFSFQLSYTYPGDFHIKLHMDSAMKYHEYIDIDWVGLFTGMNSELYGKVMNSNKNQNQIELFPGGSGDPGDVDEKMNYCLPFDGANPKRYFKEFVKLEFDKGGSSELENIIMDILAEDFSIFYKHSNDVVRDDYDVDKFDEYKSNNLSDMIDAGDIKVDTTDYVVIYNDERQG